MAVIRRESQGSNLATVEKRWEGVESHDNPQHEEIITNNLAEIKQKQCEKLAKLVKSTKRSQMYTGLNVQTLTRTHAHARTHTIKIKVYSSNGNTNSHTFVTVRAKKDKK